jgi:hypothetical protein
MIVFSVAFGAKYVAPLFARSLPSLLAERRGDPGADHAVHCDR